MAAKPGTMAAAIESIDQRLRAGLRTALDEAAEEQRQLFETATLKWKNKPKWLTRDASDDEASLIYEVVAEGDAKAIKVFGWVDQGTEPHLIFPKKPGGLLRFRLGYSARTSPIANANVGTGRASGALVYRRGVLHPGTEPREFAAYFALQAQETMYRKIKTAIKQASRR